MEGLATFSLFVGFLSFIVSIIVIWSIVSIANSNVRIRRAIELVVDELYKANTVNDVHDRYDVIKYKRQQEQTMKSSKK